MFDIESSLEFLEYAIERLASAEDIHIFGVNRSGRVSEQGEIRVKEDIPSTLKNGVSVVYGLYPCGGVCHAISSILENGNVTTYHEYVWGGMCEHILESLMRSPNLKIIYGLLDVPIVRILKESRSIVHVVISCSGAKDGMDDALCEMISYNDTLERLSLIDFARFKMGYRKLRSALSSNRSITHYNNLKNNSYWVSQRDGEDLWHITQKCETKHHNNLLRRITLFELMMEVCKNDIL